MALVQFENNTAPYLNADNLNNNFSELDTNYREIETKINELINKNFTRVIFGLPSGNISSGSWQTIGQSLNITLDKGLYLFLVTAQVTSSSSSVGIATTRVRINETDVRRQTIPIGLSLSTTSNMQFFRTLEEETTLTIDVQEYANQTTTVGAVQLWYVKLD